VTSPFVGELFYTDGEVGPTVLVPSGSGGDLGSVLPLAALLASHGCNALALAYFQEPGLPRSLSRIPLEYFERVFAWLASHERVNGKELQILGISKGGELGLLLASRYPAITRVVAMAPHAYCFQGINFRNASSWTYAGRDLPYIELKNRWVLGDMASGLLHDRPFRYAPTYVRGIERAHNREAARIKIEQAHADLLIFAGTDDGFWNADDGCREIVETLEHAHYPYQYTYQPCPGAGHAWYAPYIIPCSETTARMGPRLVLSAGGTMETNARAVANAWERAVRFLGG
jgi:dienelactone hydrolase